MAISRRFAPTLLLFFGLISWPPIPRRSTLVLPLFFDSIPRHSPSSLARSCTEEVQARSVTIKNRRRAYVEVPLKGGEYFSEDAMREREPYLHHLFLERFQDPSGRATSQPGEQWSETLMRRCKEAMLVEKIRGEQ